MRHIFPVERSADLYSPYFIITGASFTSQAICYDLETPKDCPSCLRWITVWGLCAISVSNLGSFISPLKFNIWSIAL